MINRKTLILLRHGKAENGTPTSDDHARRLTVRGTQAAELMGKYLAEQGLSPDKVLCSTAARTSETFTHVQTGFSAPLNVEFSQKLYHASGNEILSVLAASAGLANTVLVIGHNPGLHQLSLKLAKDGAEPLIDALYLKFPTCACAIFSAEGDWDELAENRPTLTHFVTPEMLGGDAD
jgi:phosphohistidine phosphatase